MDELETWLTLTRAPGIHAGVLRRLLERHASISALMHASPLALRASGASVALIEYLAAPNAERLQAELRWLEQPFHHFVAISSSHYPPLLAQLSDAPIGLFVHGNPELLSLPQLAIVGSRNPSASGRDNAREFASQLTRGGLAITSGLAIG